ncbi:multi-sensor signal transduction histidine kinase, partial [Candidatus Magnetomorum sp. HK-1]
MGIFKQTFYMIVAIIVIIIGIFVALTLMRQNEVIMKIVENQAKSLSVSVARVNQDAMVSNNFGTIVENTMALLQNISNISYIIITKGNDLILVHYKNRWEKLENFDPEWKIGDGTKDFGKIIYSDLVKSKVFHYSFQLRYWEMPIGSIYIGLSLD